MAVNMISTTGYSTKGKEIVESSSLGPIEAIYDDIQSISDDHVDGLHLMASDPYHLPYWLEPSLPTLDYLMQTFPSDESIMEIMSENEPIIWEDHQNGHQKDIEQHHKLLHKGQEKMTQQLLFL